jgi:DNA-binding transcriptional LysR family regulator
MPLATVSRKVSELEAHLRTKLFNRSSRALVPTDAGLSYIAAAKRILADISEAERAASGEYTTPRGDLNVSTLVALGRLCLQPIVAEFLVTFPEVDVQLDLQDRSVNLLEEHIDVALRVGDLADSSLIAVRVGEISAWSAPVPLSEIARNAQIARRLSPHDCISYPRCSRQPRGVQARPDRVCRARSVALRCEQSRIGLRCRARGIGITVAFSYLRRRIDQIRRAQYRFCRIFNRRRSPSSFVYLAQSVPCRSKLRAFLDFTAATRLIARPRRILRKIVVSRGRIPVAMSARKQ